MKSLRSVCFCLLSAMCLMILACTGQLFQSYGKLTPSGEAARQFERFAVNPNYRYYITGAYIQPNAILGIDRNYRIDLAALWKEVDMTPEKMKEFVGGMQRISAQIGKYQQGFIITDDKGKPIGSWYSLLEATTFVQMQKNGTVRIDTPRLNLYEMPDGDDDWLKRKKLR
ncbi:MAG: hypothetical protein M0009_08400 [Deltaproteobacteria bacterium]|nr:hypothetical protein [Deltaproteobacteria bacterium]